MRCSAGKAQVLEGPEKEQRFPLKATPHPGRVRWTMFASDETPRSPADTVIRTTLHRGSATHVDLEIRPRAWFGRVRLWRGTRWPDLERTWFGSLRPWVPWFSLERQAVEAVAQALGSVPAAHVTRAVSLEVRAAVRRLEFDERSVS